MPLLHHFQASLSSTNKCRCDLEAVPQDKNNKHEATNDHKCVFDEPRTREKSKLLKMNRNLNDSLQSDPIERVVADFKTNRLLCMVNQFQLKSQQNKKGRNSSNAEADSSLQMLKLMST